MLVDDPRPGGSRGEDLPVRGERGLAGFECLGGLPAGLRGPVALYVGVIALMAAQAIGRATALRNRGAVGLALGAGFFMLSDALLAVNRFVTPLPMAQLGVLATYYAAQILIVRHAPTHAGERQDSRAVAA